MNTRWGEGEGDIVIDGDNHINNNRSEGEVLRNMGSEGDARVGSVRANATRDNMGVYRRG